MKRKLPLACELAVVMMCACLALLWWLYGYLHWLPNPIVQYRFSLTPSPTPGYEPIIGLAYITGGKEERPGAEIELFMGPSLSRQGGGFLRHGTQVEILESVWYYKPGQYRNTACYLYRIYDPRTDVEGWIDEDRLTKDMADAPVARCAPGTPYVSRAGPQPMTGRVFLTTLGSQRDEVDFWSKPTLIRQGGEHLFSKPHGTPVEIVKSSTFFIHRPTDDRVLICYNYLVRTEDNLSGWVAGRSLTQDLSQPSSEADCE